MASACIRTMTLSQNLNNLHNVMPQNCVIISSSQNFAPAQQQQQFSSTNKMQSIAPAPSTGTGRNSTSILGMNGVNMQQQQQSHHHQQQHNNNNQKPIESVRGYKKKYTYANMPYGEQPPSVARRNARERNRVKQVNNGFANLRQHIPQTVITALTNGGRGASKKLSKVDTLKMAVEYINRLQELINDYDSDSSSNYNSAVSSAGSPTSQYFPASPPNYPIQTSTYSETSASPTPSCSSDLSIGSNHNNNNHHHHHHHHYDDGQQSGSTSANDSHQFKFEPYDNYNSIPNTTPEDEELLDYISSWQEQ